MSAVCHCDLGKKGEDCSENYCPNDCSDKGTCGPDKTCLCEPGYVGDAC